MTTTVFAGSYGPAQLLDGMGKPLANRPFAFYLQGTTTPVVLYADRAKHVLVDGERARTLVTDGRGQVSLFADPGLYDIVCGGVTFHISIGYDAAEVHTLADLNARMASIPSPTSDTVGTKASIDAIRAALNS